MSLLLGPIQDDDALLLGALIRMTMPKKCVEFGVGRSTVVILEALTADAQLISYDVDNKCPVADHRLTFKVKSQLEYEESDIDFAFIDASHDFEMNKALFLKLKNTLTKEALVVVHDTGLWKEAFVNTGGHMTIDGYAHQIGERRFVNWIKNEFPLFQSIHLHTMRKIRHGITILQSYNYLVTVKCD